MFVRIEHSNSDNVRDYIDFDDVNGLIGISRHTAAYLARYSSGNEVRPVVVKFPKKGGVDGIERLKRQSKIQSDRNLLPQVISFLPLRNTDGSDTCALITEYRRGISLSKFISNDLKPKFEDVYVGVQSLFNRYLISRVPTTCTIVKGISTAVREMHANGIVHGELTTDNVMLTDTGTVCLTSTGKANGFWEKQEDIFRIGIIAYQLAIGRSQVEEVNLKDINSETLRLFISKVLKGKYENVSDLLDALDKVDDSNGGKAKLRNLLNGSNLNFKISSDEYGSNKSAYELFQISLDNGNNSVPPVFDPKKEAEAARLRAEQEEKRQAEAEAARLRAEQEAKRQAEAETARLRAEQEAKRQAEAEAARLRAEQEAKRQAEAEAARLRAEQEEKRQAEAEAARLRAEQEAKRQAEAETARLRAEQEAKRQAEAEAARLRAEQEAKRQAEAETARLHAEQEAKRQAEAETARLRAEQKAKKEPGDKPVNKKNIILFTLIAIVLLLLCLFLVKRYSNFSDKKVDQIEIPTDNQKLSPPTNKQDTVKEKAAEPSVTEDEAPEDEQKSIDNEETKPLKQSTDNSVKNQKENNFVESYKQKKNNTKTSKTKKDKEPKKEAEAPKQEDNNGYRTIGI